MRNFILLCCLVFLSCSGEDSYKVTNYSGGALGTSYNLILHSREEVQLQPAIDSLFEAVNASMSTYQADSEISRINAGDSSVVTDPMFREVFRISEQVYRDTDGAFDPTVGVLVDAWGFGPGDPMVMDSSRVDSLMPFVGFSKVSLGDDGRIAKSVPGLRFDFNAVAKGYAIDRLALLMDEHGIANYLLELGGEVVARGHNTIKEKPWIVGVDDPEAGESRSIKITLRLQNEALASSGNYRKFRVDPESGERYVHTVDPRTGYTRNSNILASTVVAPSCAVADAYATAFMAMDLEASKVVLSGNEDLHAYLVYVDENGKTAEYMTDGFRERVSGPRE